VYKFLFIEPPLCGIQVNSRVTNIIFKGIPSTKGELHP